MDKEFKVGDKVFDLRYGNGEVVKIVERTCFSIICKFDYCNAFYTPDGKTDLHRVKRILYHGHDLIVTVKEPTYVWQILAKYLDGIYFITDDFYKSVENYESCVPMEHIELFEPSKRLLKESKS